MKKSFTAISVLAMMTLTFSGTVRAADAASYAYVDVASVFDKYQKTIDNDKTLQESGKKKELDRDALVSEIRQLKDELVLLKDDAKAKKQENLDAKIRELQEFDQAAKEQLGKVRRDAIQGIFQDIDGVVQGLGKKKGVSLIFNERALLYHDAKLDITSEVLTELNANYAAQQKGAKKA